MWFWYKIKEAQIRLTFSSLASGELLLVCLTGKGEQVTLFKVLMVLIPAHCSEVRSFWVPALDSDCS